MLRGLRSEARVLLHGLRSRWPDCVPAHLGVARLTLEDGDAEEAGRILGSVVDATGADLEERNWLACLASWSADPGPDAMPCMREQLANGTHPDLVARALVHYLTSPDVERQSDALGVVVAAVELQPDHSGLRQLEAEVRRDLGQRGRARAILAALATTPIPVRRRRWDRKTSTIAFPARRLKVGGSSRSKAR